MSSSSSSRCLRLLEKCKDLKELKQAHGQVITSGLSHNTFAHSRLLAFFSSPHNLGTRRRRTGSISYAWEIFEKIQEPTVCIVNTMIKAFFLSNELTRTLGMYKHMLQIGMCPDNYTFPYLLKACSDMESYSLGSSIHGQCLKFGFLADTYVGNSLISMYSELGVMKDARYVFDEMPSHCVVAWTVLISGYSRTGDVFEARLVFDESPVKDRGVWGSMISGYVQNNCFKEGLQMFRVMQMTGVQPDEMILVSILSACAQLGSLENGKWVQRYLEKLGMAMTVRLGTALVDMYAKCGRLDFARELFDKMPVRDVICWNAMISGFAMNGRGEEAMALFQEMQNSGTRPDDITLISLLTACTTCPGMASEGLKLLSVMCNTYNIQPKGEHYACLIHLISKEGFLEEARNLVQSAHTEDEEEDGSVVAWRALLSGCVDHGEVCLAEAAAEKVFRLERHDGAYVLLSNLYAAAGKHDGAKRVRKMMRKKKELIDKKTPGCSSVEINGVVHEFVAGENL
ncbi:hypothetical protein DM860_008263 [Cuscuta australis]|uniref:Pentacotripeptide-repeat region of PRORP domain-containing protein n=1 Tax=Cuscuta australis TaxID=267555 RepID=A0A328D831_9ASTE|nr:hypothetical protein DM860_008263 [Cuscuta australis]